MNKNTENKVNLLDKMSYKGVWRDYQKDFLDEIEYYLEDKKLNVVAAPGAGKTTLGLEIIKRIAKPALILSPAITIKNQWKERLVRDFLPSGCDTNDFSLDIRDIKTITSTTYQAVHTLIKDMEGYKNFLNDLKKKGVKTVVFDESHHLRTEWYQTLSYLCGELKAEDFTIVSLTATPPYDVSESEQKNYKDLCGPADVEIPIPKLVQNGDLCPHGDIIYFSDTSESEKKIIYDFKKCRKDFWEYINTKGDFPFIVKSSVFVRDYQNNVELIYDDINFTVSLISYLLSLDDMSIEAKILTDFLCIEKENIPKFGYDLANTLFNGILGKYNKYFKNTSELKHKLKEHNLLTRSKTVDFKGETDLKKLYALSSEKLSSIKKITEIEASNLKKDLREVVLLDYTGVHKTFGLNAVSAFNLIRETEIPDFELYPGVLTGSLTVIPEKSKDIFYSLLEKYGIKKENVLAAPYDDGFIRLETYGNTNLVPVITELFSKGEINVLIGTQALLGEGWDAPCINTLIIAASIGSFMLSNQMRGRALRINKTDPNKTSNIWHLVCLSKGEESSDYEIIQRRFKAFEGLTFGDNKIQNGTQRLGYDEKDIMNADIEALNKHSIMLANNRNNLKKAWKNAFSDNDSTKKIPKSTVYETVLVPGVKLPFVCCCQSEFWLYKIFKNFVAKTHVKNSEKDLFDILNAILKTLCDCRAIYTDYEKIKIINKINYLTKEKSGGLNITIINCHNFERDVFINAVNEFFAPSGNERFIIKKEISDKKGNLKGIKYYSVPLSIGTNAKNVKIFIKNLTPAIGYCSSVFTRNPLGRKELIKALYGNSLKHETRDVKRAKMWF